MAQFDPPSNLEPFPKGSEVKEEDSNSDDCLLEEDGEEEKEESDQEVDPEDPSQSLVVQCVFFGLVTYPSTILVLKMF